MKKWVGRKRFSSNKKLIAETQAYFAEFEKSYSFDGLKKLGHPWIKYIHRSTRRLYRKIIIINVNQLSCFPKHRDLSYHRRINY